MTEKSDPKRLMKICRASSSLPLFSPIVNIDGTPYLDGGLADSVPIERALEIGNEKIVVILTRNPGYRKKMPSKGVMKIYRSSYKTYPNLLRTIARRSIVYNRTMEKIEKLEEEGKIFVLRPQMKTVSRLERNADTLTDFYNHRKLQNRVALKWFPNRRTYFKTTLFCILSIQVCWREAIHIFI